MGQRHNRRRCRQRPSLLQQQQQQQRYLINSNSKLKHADIPTLTATNPYSDLPAPWSPQYPLYAAHIQNALDWHWLSQHYPFSNTWHARLYRQRQKQLQQFQQLRRQERQEQQDLMLLHSHRQFDALSFSFAPHADQHEHQQRSLQQATANAHVSPVEAQRIRLFGGEVGDEASLCASMLQVVLDLWGGIDYVDP